MAADGVAPEILSRADAILNRTLQTMGLAGQPVRDSTAVSEIRKAIIAQILERENETHG